MRRMPKLVERNHGDIDGDFVYHRPNEAVSGVWLHKNVFIEVHRRQGKTIVPELMAKLREEVKK